MLRVIFYFCGHSPNTHSFHVIFRKTPGRFQLRNALEILTTLMKVITKFIRIRGLKILWLRGISRYMTANEMWLHGILKQKIGNLVKEEREGRRKRRRRRRTDAALSLSSSPISTLPLCALIDGGYLTVLILGCMTVVPSSLLSAFYQAHPCTRLSRACLEVPAGEHSYSWTLDRRLTLLYMGKAVQLFPFIWRRSSSMQLQRDAHEV